MLTSCVTRRAPETASERGIALDSWLRHVHWQPPAALHFFDVAFGFFGLINWLLPSTYASIGHSCFLLPSAAEPGSLALFRQNISARDEEPGTARKKNVTLKICELNHRGSLPKENCSPSARVSGT